MLEFETFSDQLARIDRSGTTLFHHTEHSAKDDILAAVRNHARPVQANSELMFEGDRVHSAVWVLKGWLGLSKILDDGRRQIIDVAIPVDLIAVTAANGASSPYGVTALTDGVIASYPVPLLARQKAAFEPLARIIDRLTAAANARKAERMLRLGQGTACERVAHTLLELFLRLEAAGQTAATSFRLPITQREFGDLTGLTSVHVCRTLRRMMRDGLIGYFGQQITILDLAGLARIGRLDLESFREEIIPPTA